MATRQSCKRQSRRSVHLPQPQAVNRLSLILENRWQSTSSARAFKAFLTRTLAFRQPISVLLQAAPNRPCLHSTPMTLFLQTRNFEKPTVYKVLWPMASAYQIAKGWPHSACLPTGYAAPLSSYLNDTDFLKPEPKQCTTSTQEQNCRQWMQTRKTPPKT